ncbi:MAG: c-type cytochrome, partial [Actinomycetota bacterium]|nr:c-type cytochrome [Actinomycetota bacterium]
CGLEHANMLASVEVMPAAEFAAWLAEQEGDRASVELGEEEWRGACAKCHGLGGEGGIAPQISGSPVLTDPQELEKIVRNGRGEMPAVGSGWSEEQMDALIAYLRESPPSGS